MSQPEGPDQAQVVDAATATLLGWGAELDTFQKFWWMDWRKMIEDVITAVRTGEPVLYEDDEPREPSATTGGSGPVDQLVDLLCSAFRPRDAGAWLLAPNRSLGGRRPIAIIAKGDIEAVRSAAEVASGIPPPARSVGS